MVVNANSTPQSYTLTGSNLTANVTVTAPTGYRVATSQSGTYNTSLTVNHTGGSVNTTIWVRFQPTSAQYYGGNVSNSSSGATTVNVSVNGTGVTPSLEVSPSSLSFGNVTVDTNSTPQSYALSGSNLTANVTVTAPTGYRVATSQSGTYSTSLTVNQSGGSVNTTIWVRFQPTSDQSYSGNVSNSSSGATTVNVSVSGTGVNPTVPVISVNPTSLSFGNVTVDTNSTPQSYTLSGSNLTGNVTVTAPTGYRVATSQSGTYSTSLTVNHSGGSVNATIWVRFQPTSAQYYGGNVSNSSSGATTVNVSVSGTGVSPGGTPISLQVSHVSGNLMSLSWNEIPGAGSYRIYYSDTPEPYDSDAWVQIYEVTGLMYLAVANSSYGFYHVRPVDSTPSYEDFVYVPGGTFTMGRTTGSGDSDELPTHSVTLNSFYIGKYEVTQAEYAQYMQPSSSWTSNYGLGGNYPAYYVSWYAILKYCNLRSMAEGLSPVYSISGSTDPANWGNVPTSNNSTWNAAICNWNANGYRLPTEAEWEYAARGRTNNPDYLYSGSDDINAVAWYSGNNTPYGSKPVGTKAPNGIGTYDMSGNLWEWCWDWSSSSYYSSSPSNNPTGPNSGSSRVGRGGNWFYHAAYCRVADRSGNGPCDGYHNGGFRLCRAIN
ncbi:MAG: SUMF1/EgtB/PvdO family nonheme iron enzyme [Candidatus Cloacimonetes bacterium]|nr:SUMF1/EgtB/PvdO family nonheme iron enzyme [Candidatus Cloacimonadota bacterium]